MKLIRAPDTTVIEYKKRRNHYWFLAGGITNCPPWSDQVVEAMEDYDIVLFDPRRKDFDVTNPNMERDQIRWEHVHLSISQGVMFWFPEETLCPITLLELGKVMAWRTTDLIVGCHPGYKRKRDVRYQLDNMGYNHIPVYSSVTGIIEELQRQC